MNRTLARRLFVAAAFLAVFTALAWFSLESKYLDDLTRGHHGTFARRLLEETTGVYSFLLLLPLAVWSTRRSPIGRQTWWYAIPIAIASALLFSAAHTTLMAASRHVIAPWMGLGQYDYGIMRYRYPMEASNDVVWYGIVVAAIYAWDRLAAARRAELDAADVRTKLVETQLENLRLQLKPHFLFNTLNAISSVMYEDVRKADEMLAKLSDFLRTVLSSSSVQHVTLDEELAIENMYVDIMKTRLERSLQLRVRVEDAARDAIVPFMILQPLLENSIRHGAVPSRSAMAIDIDVTRRGEFTVIRVADDGAGISDASPRGHGLRNVRDRLHYTYGDAAAFSLAAGPGGGAVATLTFPSIPRNGTCASS